MPLKFDGIEVGDIVLDYPRFGWFVGHESWVSNPDAVAQRDGGNENYAFYYVVTAIAPAPNDPHRLAYHVATLAMTANTGYHSGYKVAYGQSPLTKVSDPPAAVLAQSKDLLGTTTRWPL